MEKKILSLPGIIGVIIQLGLVVHLGLGIYTSLEVSNMSGLIFPVIELVLFLILFGGYRIIQPNQATVESFMGKYEGTLAENGFYFINPLYSGVVWSLKVENDKTKVLKVNEKTGVPIEISATITYKVKDTYKAQYDVENVKHYVDNQFEISLRRFAQLHKYADLSGDSLEFTEDLKEKVSIAGIEIIEAKVTHLNYAAEIAGAMLQKQQATAMNDAKEVIVNTAVSIAKKAADQIGETTSEQKVKFISDLIIVLCSDKSVSPVINV